jgi:hypothetical protein
MLAHPPSLQKLTLLANGISGRKIARHAVFPLICVRVLPRLERKMTIVVPVVPFANRVKK